MFKKLETVGDAATWLGQVSLWLTFYVAFFAFALTSGALDTNGATEAPVMYPTLTLIATVACIAFGWPYLKLMGRYMRCSTCYDSSVRNPLLHRTVRFLLGWPKPIWWVPFAAPFLVAIAAPITVAFFTTPVISYLKLTLASTAACGIACFVLSVVAKIGELDFDSTTPLGSPEDA